ncbi:hypothetical protein [Jeotgalibaca sp. A122]|uniref:hypothetical protein n=1 Tax=Jeotgalibaca sp. A122 TaxID=3457322 RepID=UPI003FD635A9
MSKRNKNIIFTLLLFYVLFPFSLDSIHLLQDLMNLGLSLLVIIFNIPFLEEKVQFFNPKLFSTFLLVAFIGLLALILPSIYGTFDYSYFMIVVFSAVQQLIKFTALMIVYLRIFKEEATFSHYAMRYIVACILYFLFTILFILAPGLKEFWIQLLYISDLDISQLQKPQYVTRIGIDGFAGFGQTFKFSLGILLSVFLIAKDFLSNKRRSIFLLGAILMLLMGTLFYGRIGSVAGFVAILVLLVNFFSYQRTLKTGLSFIAMSFILFLLVIVASLFNEAILVWLEWAFELIITFINTGEFSSTSTDILFERMYFIPDLKSFLIGNALYSDPAGGYFMGTDVGILRNILFFGFIPTLIVYLVIAMTLYGIKDFLTAYGKCGRILLGLLVFTFLLFEFKGSIYQAFYPILVPFYGILLYENKRSKKSTTII